MSKQENINELIRERLSNSQRPMIISHMRPDGDAIGSLVGMGLALRNLGKEPNLILEDGLPSKYRFLTGSEMISKGPAEEADLIISLDCSDQNRMGETFSKLEFDINIDHHITNDNFGAINLIIPEYPATSAILAEFLPQWNFPLDSDSSSALLMGILTDTIGFRTSNVTPTLLRQAANLMEMGADLSKLYTQTLVSLSFPSSLIWGFSLSRLVKEDRLVWTTITLEDRKNANYIGRDDADLTNVLSAIEETDVSIVFNEQNGGKVKVSWRSNDPYNVSWIAQQFGGGGHPPASGAEIEGTLEDVENAVLNITKQYMKELSSKGDPKNG